jgi:hypothetical protein
MPWEFVSYECGSFGGCGLRKKSIDGCAFDEPSAIDEQNLVTQPPRLRKVVRRHYDLGPARMNLTDDGL